MDRNRQIDIARGLMIFLVVGGHIVPGLAAKLIYSFHMPFFFMLSGFLHRVRDQEARYFKNRLVTFLTPYIIYLICFLIVPISFLLVDLMSQPSISVMQDIVKSLAKSIYGGELLRERTGVFWFITCLFFTQQLFNFVALRLKDKFLLELAVLLYIMSMLDQTYFRHLIFPWSINAVLCAFPFYCFGSKLGNYIFEERSKQLFDWLALMISIFVICLVIYNVPVYFDIKYTYYGIPFVSFLGAVSLTRMVMHISRFLSSLGFLSSGIAFAGKCSLTVMYCHQFFHFQMLELCARFPWLMSFLIFIICCVLHYCFLKSSVLRGLLLGSEPDISFIMKLRI